MQGDYSDIKLRHLSKNDSIEESRYADISVIAKKGNLGDIAATYPSFACYKNVLIILALYNCGSNFMHPGNKSNIHDFYFLHIHALEFLKRIRICKRI